MKRVLTVLAVVIAACATPLAAQDKSYAEVRHLYEKAFDAIEETEESFADASYAELSWELMEFGDLDLLARAPRKVTHDISLAIVDANLALAHARAGYCPAALQLADRAFNPSLVKRLTSPWLGDRAWTALNSIVRTFARCGAIERIEEIVADDEPGRRVITEYLDRADSTIASSHYLAGDLDQAEHCMAKAKARAHAMDDERVRNYALFEIAFQQVIAGRPGDALQTAKTITIAPLRSYKGPGLSQVSQNLLLEKIAFGFAAQGAWDDAFAALDSRKVDRRESPDTFVLIRLDYAKTLEKEAALNSLTNLQRYLAGADADRDLLLLLPALADVGAEAQALVLLDDLYNKQLALYRISRPGASASATILAMLDSIVRGYVLIGRPQDALARLTSEPLAGVKVDSLLGSWSALFGHALLHDDTALLRRVERVLANATHWRYVDNGTFAYLLDRRAFTEAERFIEGMEATSRPYAYSRLAREQMGISFWDDIRKRQSRGY